MEEMDINTALGIAKGLKNHFRAFERLDAFVKEAVSLQGVMKDFETRKAAIQEEIAGLESKKREMAEIEIAHAEMEREKEKLEKTVKDLKREIEGIKAKLSG